MFSKSVEAKNKTGKLDGESPIELDESSPYYKDFLSFDGNPQALRVCITLQGNPGMCGFNLTYSQIGALTKYPKSSADDFSYKKIGVFQTELAQVQKIWRDEGIEWGRRNPLVYLMEAADDIAYSLSDIEDGIEKKIITEAEIIQDLRNQFGRSKLVRYKSIVDRSARGSVTSSFVSFRTQMINDLVDRAADIFYDVYTKDDFPESIFRGVDAGKAIKIINDLCMEKLYRSAEAEDIEIAGYNIVYGILEKFSILLAMPIEDFSKLVTERKGKDLCRRMFSKLPDSLVSHYKHASDNDREHEWYHRVRLIVDYVCGMTDDFALKVYRLLHGISVEVI